MGTAPPADVPRRSRVGALGLALTLAVATGAFVGSGCRTVSLHYPHSTPEGTAQSFCDAFNRKEKDQIKLMVHADRRKIFDEHKADLDAQLQTYTIQRWEMGERVVVDGKLEGREIVLYFADGSSTRSNKAILVETEGDWWLWKY